MDPSAGSLRATAAGGLAIALFSTMAVLAATARTLPPFQLLAMAFGIATALTALVALLRGEGLQAMFRQPLGAWAMGVGGFFGFHFAYFLAFHHTAPAEASLICYLWPLLLILFSSLLPGERWHWGHLVGGACGLLGTWLLVAGQVGPAPGSRWLGDLAALVAAVSWAGYSVASRRYASLPVTAVGGYCAVVAVIALVAHLLTERTIWPTGISLWAVLGIGLGPSGVAFFAWDQAVKRGRLATLGTISYAAPLLSTLWLVLAGMATPSWALLGAAVLIVGGAALGSWIGR